MSKTVDEKVVEMRFDNKQFESNVKTSMSTIERLKESLNFKGVEKGFDNVSRAAEKCDISPLAKAVDKVGTKFSAIEVAGITAMANITNSAVNAGKRLLSSLSMDQISAGWKKYGDKTSAVQTIIAATGKSIDEVNHSLEKLNWFTDETSYNLLDMTNNIGKFTSNGIELDVAVTAMEGIANAAALSGSGIENASHAMEGFSKAIAQGSMTRINWNWIKTARMDTQQFKESMIEAGLAAGTLVKVGNQVKTVAKGTAVSFQDFESAMAEGWMTTEVMLNALGTYGGFADKLYNACNVTNMTASELLDSIDKYKEGTLNLQDVSKESGITVETLTAMYEELGSETLKLGQKSFRAAQEAKTFTEAIDSVKDAVSTGWMNTYELIFGNYEQAKKLWTDLANTLYDVFAEGGNRRNEILQEALGSPLSNLSGKIASITKVTATEVDKIKNYEEILSRIINGDFGNGQKRIEKLTELGFDWAHAQNLVNKALGSSVEHASDYSEIHEILTEEIKELTDTELENLGWTVDEISAYRDLQKQSKATGKSISELIGEMDEMDGRTLLINSFKNVGSGLLKVLESIKKAWADVFPPMTSSRLYNIIKSLNDFSKKLSMSDETADKLRRTLKGLFSVLDLIKTIISVPIKTGIKLLNKLLGSMNVDILGVTASVGDAIYNFTQWVKSFIDFEKIASNVSGWIQNLVNRFKEWIEILKESDNIPRDIFIGIVNAVKNASKRLREQIKPFVEIASNITLGFANKILKNAGPVGNVIKKFGLIIIQKLKDIGNNISANSIFGDKISGFVKMAGQLLTGFINGLKEKTGPLGEAIAKIGRLIIDKVKEVLEIHSPSRVFFWIGQMIVAGLVGGILAQSNDVIKPMKELGSKCINALKSFIEYLDFQAIGEWIKNSLKSLDLGKILFLALDFGFIKFANKTLDTVNALTKTIDKFASPLTGINNILNAVAARIKPDKWESRANAILKIAVAIDLLVGAVYLLTKIDRTALWESIGAIAALGGVLTLFSFISSKIPASSGNISAMIISISASLYIMAKALKQLDFINEGNFDIIINTLWSMVIALVGVIAALGLTVKGKTAANIGKASFTIMAVSAALLLMTKVLEQVSSMEWGDIKKGLACIAGFGVIIGALIAMSSLAGKNSAKIGIGILGISAAMILMIQTIKMISKITDADLDRGFGCIEAFGIIIMGLIAITRLAGGSNASKIGSTILGISAAMALMAITIKIVSGMSEDDLIKGWKCIGVFGLIVAGLIATTGIAGSNLKGVAATIIAASVAIGIIAGIAVILGMVDLPSLAKGVGAVSILGAIMALMIHTTKGAENCQKNIIAMAVAIGVMTASVVALSMIDSAKLLNATLALSTVMAMFALMESVAEKAKGAMGSIIAISIAVGLIGGVLYLLAGLPVESVLSSAAALSTMLLAMSVSLAIVSKFGNSIEDSIVGVVGLLALAVPLVAFVGILALMQGIQNAEKNADILITFMTAMTEVLIKISLLAPLALVGVAAITALISLMGIMGALIVAVGALTEHFPQIETFINSGVSLLSKLANGIGLIVGNFINGIAVGISSGLPEVATNLSLFMTNLEPFISGVKTIDGSIVDNVKSLVKMMLLLTGAGLLNSITSFLNGSNNIDEFGKQLISFGQAIKEYSDSVEGIKVAEIETSIKAGHLIGDLAKNIPNSGGMLGAIVGNNDMDKFGKQLVTFGESLKSYADAVMGINTEGIEKSVNAGKLLTELADSIPNSGGLWGLIAGDNDIKKFGKKLVSFGESIVEFSNTLADAKNVSSMIPNISNFGKAMSKLGENGIDKLVKSFQNAPSKIRKEAEKIIKAFTNTIKTNTDSFKNSGKAVVEGFSKGITENSYLAINAINKMITAVKTATNEGLNINSPSKVFVGIGKSVGEGFEKGIADKKQTSRVISATTKLASDVTLSAKSELGVNSPSRAFIEIGKHIGEGLAQGIRDSAWRSVNAIESVAQSVIDVAKSKFEDIESYIENEKFYDNMTIEQEIAIWESVIDKYAEGSEEWVKANKNLYTALKTSYENNFNDIKNYISDEEDYNRMSTKRKLEIWKEAQQQYKLGTKERKEIDKNIYSLTHELIDDDTEALKAYRKELEKTLSTLEKGTPLYWETLAESEYVGKLIGKGSYNDSEKWIENEEFYGRMDPSRKLLAKSRELGQSIINQNEDNQQQIKRDIYTSQKTLYDSYKQFKEDVKDLYEDAGNQRVQLEKDYDEKVLNIKKEYNDKMAEADEQYESELKSRTKSLYDSYGLFDEVQKKEEVSGTALMQNLQDQVDEFEEWQKTLNSLSARGLNESLIEELQEMGPSSVAQIKALNSMSDSQLQQYATLWGTKHRLAKEQATNELEDLRIETNNTIKSLKKDMQLELDKAKIDLDNDLEELNSTVKEKAETLKDNFLKEVGVIPKDTETEMREMETIVASILGAVVQNAGIEGANLVANYAGNIANNAWILYDTIDDIMSNAAKQFNIDPISKTVSSIGDWSQISKDNFNKALKDVHATIVPTIAPVTNLSGNVNTISGLFSGERTANISASLSFNNQNGDTNQEKMISHLQKVVDSHNKIVPMLTSINDRVNKLAEEMEEMQIVMDTGALVGAIAPDVDNALGGIAKMNLRGAV